MPITFVSVLGTGTGCLACLEGAWDLAKTQRQPGFRVPADFMGCCQSLGLSDILHARAHTTKERARRLLCLSYILTIALHTQHFHAQLFHTQLFHIQLSHTTLSQTTLSHTTLSQTTLSRTQAYTTLSHAPLTHRTLSHTAQTTLSHTTLVIIDPPPPPLSFLPSPFRCNFYF